ncbi:swr1-complex 5 [Lecanosticta acicola]|uniref:SWR1-complex protein 5 n=1 Tax=Lecanosticta acicola TaxID=111012 RepID=A0AAI8YTL1_9PEZI|nr:swr1-complex 5 [Lecanosticta acicola]
MEDEYMEDVDQEEEEEEYDENADEDFSPDKADKDGEGASSSEDEEAGETPAATSKKPRKRKSEVADENLDSGDEATIKERKSKKRRKDAREDDESGGEGGFVRTRAQRVAEKEERKHRKRARDGEVTIDVDQVWAELSSVPVGKIAPALLHPVQVVSDGTMDVDGENKENAPISSTAADELITIKRRIEYAGETTEVEEQVPRSSKEAQSFLIEHPEADPNYKSNNANALGLSRPFKRPSMFEPNPTGFVKGVAPEKLRLRAPTRMDVLMTQKREEEKKKAQKMTTVEKSRVDWKGFVDKEEGLKDQLNEYGRGRGNYLDREGFLGRAQAAREQAARDARMKL